MSIIQKFILLVKKLFNKQEDIKTLEAHKQTMVQDRKIDFIDSLKITALEKKEYAKVQTLVCEGDGLVIKKKISY